MATSLAALSPLSPVPDRSESPIIFDDPRCTPEDTFATWFLRNQWPALAQGPWAEAWTITERLLRIPHPESTMFCKGCGARDTPDNPLLWGNLDTAQANGSAPTSVPTAQTKQLIKAQDYSIKSGDTDISLIGYHASAPMIYCLACTLSLSTKVMREATGDKNLAFWWTPRRTAWPWTTYGAIWELPRERPLIFRAAPGPGHNHEKWAVSIPINWDPHIVLFPLVDRKTTRGVYWHPVNSDRLASLPDQFVTWVTPQYQAWGQAHRQKFPWSKLIKPEVMPWVTQTLQLPPRHRRIGFPVWNQEAVIQALFAYAKERLG